MAGVEGLAKVRGINDVDCLTADFEAKSPHGGARPLANLSSEHDEDWHRRLLAMREQPRVYFIGWEDGPVKIGHAQDVRHRLHQIQAHCPFDLGILATREGGRDLEAFYHQRFAGCRMRGEWFARGHDLMREIGKLNGTVPGRGMLFPPRPILKLRFAQPEERSGNERHCAVR